MRKDKPCERFKILTEIKSFAMVLSHSQILFGNVFIENILFRIANFKKV